jgi:hypothetical protein
MKIRAQANNILGTFDVLLTTYGTGTAAGMATTTTTIGGGTILMAALLGTLAKAKILRELRSRRGGKSIFPIHIPIFRRGKREAEAHPVDTLTDQELEYILSLLDNAPAYSV